MKIGNFLHQIVSQAVENLVRTGVLSTSASAVLWPCCNVTQTVLRLAAPVADRSTTPRSDSYVGTADWVERSLVRIFEHQFVSDHLCLAPGVIMACPRSSSHMVPVPCTFRPLRDPSRGVVAPRRIWPRWGGQILGQLLHRVYQDVSPVLGDRCLHSSRSPHTVCIRASMPRYPPGT